MYLYCIEDHFGEQDEEYKYSLTDGILVPESLWAEWTSTCSSTMIVRLQTHIHAQIHTHTQICVVASYHKEDRHVIYAPQWMFQHFKKGDEVQYETLWSEEDDEESLPLAMSIKIKPLDNAFYHSDIQENLSEYLSNFQTLQTNTVLSIPIKELGGYHVDIVIEECKPSSEVLLRGEVPLELGESFEPVAEWSEPPQQNQLAQQSPAPPQPTDDFFGPMVPLSETKPTSTSFIGKGNSLGK